MFRPSAPKGRAYVSPGQATNGSAALGMDWEMIGSPEGATPTIFGCRGRTSVSGIVPPFQGYRLFRLTSPGRRSFGAESLLDWIADSSVNVNKLIQAQQDLAELGQRLVGVGGGVASGEGALGFDEGEHLRSLVGGGDSPEGNAVGVID